MTVYAFTCRCCGANGEASNHRGPRRQRCLDCQFAHQSTDGRGKVRDCVTCGSSFEWKATASRPPARCPDCIVRVAKSWSSAMVAAHNRGLRRSRRAGAGG